MRTFIRAGREQYSFKSMKPDREMRLRKLKMRLTMYWLKGEWK